MKDQEQIPGMVTARVSPETVTWASQVDGVLESNVTMAV